MKKLIITYLITALSITISYGQGGFKRQFKLPNSFNNTTQAVFETTPNNYIVCGIVVDTLNNFLTNRLAFIGLNEQGQVQWSKKYGNKKFEYLDNVIITKWFYKQGGYIYHAGCVRDSTNKYLGVFIKINFNGDTIWQKRFYEVGYDVVPQQVTASIDGGFLICGMVQNSSTTLVLLIKTDANGNELWRKKINKAVPNTHDAKAILQDTLTKKIVTVGYQYLGSSTQFAGYCNVMIYDSLGNVLSQVTYPSGVEGVLKDVIQTTDKKIIAIGNVKNPLMIGSTETYRSYAVKFDLNMPNTIIWQKQFDIASPGNIFVGIKEFSNEQLLLTGVLDTNLQHNILQNTLHRILKLDKNGNEISKTYYNYQTNTATQNIQGMISFEPTSDKGFIAGFKCFNTSPNPFFVVKYDSLGCDSSSFYCQTVGLEELKYNNQRINVYPNPIIETLNIQFNEDLNTADCHIKIISILGQVMYIGKLESKIEIKDLEKGIYFLQVLHNYKLIANKKIIKE